MNDTNHKIRFGRQISPLDCPGELIPVETKEMNMSTRPYAYNYILHRHKCDSCWYELHLFERQIIHS